MTDDARLAYRLSEVAAMLDVEQTQLHDAIQAGVLPALHIGARTIIVPVGQIEVYRQWAAGAWPRDEPRDEKPSLDVRLARLEAQIADLERALLDVQQRKPKSKRKQVPSKLAWEVIERDQGFCRYCGRKVYKAMRTIDHVAPVSRGGDNSPENLVLACSTCNARKGARYPDEAGMELLPIGTWKKRR